MKQISSSIATLCVISNLLFAAEPVAQTPAKPVLKIIPGQVIVPTDAMRRIWGELVSLDCKTRTGTFRKESTDELISFTVLPYAELLHHAAFGDLQDFRIGERAIFRLHENDKGEWVWLTYIQDEMNMMNGHKEYFYVDAIDAEKGLLTCTQANFDMSFVREKAIVIGTDRETRYWLVGQPARFGDIKVGDKLRTKTHGTGKGKTRVTWEVFLDDESLSKFQAGQKAVHARRMSEEGAPGYVDAASATELSLTLFQESGDQSHRLKTGQKVRVAPAGVDRKAIGTPTPAVVSAVKMAGNLGKVTVLLSRANSVFKPAEVARLWIDEAVTAGN